MQEQKKDNVTTLIALSTACMAVIAAITTLYVGKFSSRTVLQQAQETDQWAFYQAKSIKGHAYEMQKRAMELSLIEKKGRLSREAAAAYENTIKGYDENIKRYEGEKKEIKDKAETLARDKTDAQARGGKFGIALIFLQIAIMLSSVSAITRKRPLWYFGLATAVVGIFYFADGFYLFY